MNKRLAVHLLLVSLLLVVLGPGVSAAPQPGRVHFTAVGDIAQTAESGPVLDAINGLDSDFTLALGDLSYGTAGGEQAWCDFVTSHVGAGYPFELVAGNHESNGLNGNINDFAACLPNQLPGVIGTYGRQYYVDVPAVDPLVRVIMLSPSLGFPDGTYAYPAGSARYRWTSDAIDGARSAAIPWVVVGMHKPCLTAGRYACDAGPDLFNLLLSKRVDLVLSGHEHNYQRSKQLTVGAACPALAPGRFDAGCVVDADDTLTQGAGTVAMVVGTGGRALYDVSDDDPEAGYFRASSGANNNPTFGVLDVTASRDSLRASFVRGAGGTFGDSFTITRATESNTPPTASLGSTCTELTFLFDGSDSSDPDGSIVSYAWDFGDGTTALGANPSHTYDSAGSYTVRLTVTDNQRNTGSATQDLSVTAPAAKIYAADDFARAVSAGFGAAPTGGGWTFTGSPNTLSVDGAGNLRLDAARKQAAYLSSVSAPSTDLRLGVALAKPVTGGGVQFTAFARRAVGQGGYGARLKFYSSGAVALEIIRESGTGADSSLQPPVPTGLAYAVGDTLNVRVQTLGRSPTTIRAKVWKAGAPEPVAWQRSVTDTTAGLQAPGSVGVSSYISSSATNAPVTVSIDDLLATAPD